MAAELAIETMRAVRTGSVSTRWVRAPSVALSSSSVWMMSFTTFGKAGRLIARLEISVSLNWIGISFSGS